METVALQQPAVRTVVENDVFRLNDMPNVKYGVFAFTQGQHTSTTDGGFTTYGFSLFYVDRLNEDRSNQIQIQSTGDRTLRNILLTLADEEIEVGSYIIQPFNQRFDDECAGVYCTVQLTVPNEGTCPDWVPSIPDGNVVTSAELEKILTRSTVRVDRIQELTEEQQARALDNIGGASSADVSGLSEIVTPYYIGVGGDDLSEYPAGEGTPMKKFLERVYRFASTYGHGALWFYSYANESGLGGLIGSVVGTKVTMTSTTFTVMLSNGSVGEYEIHPGTDPGSVESITRLRSANVFAAVIDGVVRYDKAQSLDGEQQAQARTNIGAGAAVVVEDLSGPVVELSVAGNHEYVCGEVSSLTVTSVENSAAVSVVRFRSGATPTELTLPATLPVTGWRIPQPDTTYDLYFRGGAATIVWYE